VAAEAMGARSHRFTAALTGTAGATWVAATGAETPESAAYGIALLSRYAVVHWQVLRLPRIPLRFPMWLPGPRKVIVVHDEPRTVVIGTFRTPLGDVTIANTHLSFVPGWGGHQLRRVIRDLAVFADPVVLMGDLNMVTPTAATRAGYRSLARHDTFPVVEPDRQLDHILVRGGLGRVTDSRAQLLMLSDHRALVVDVAEA
jgi:endonuclease/exonuclease/phosphatase family metal-dependent hydrolase